MYEESANKNSFIKDMVIKLLYMFLFLFLFMWLYPAPKVDLKDVKVNVDQTAIKPLLNGVFADNLEAMRSSARAYYTVERLPKNKGDKATMKLQEMLNKKMVAPFVGEDGKSCDTDSSYVEVTKNTDDYSLKIYLACGDKKDYIVDTIGCTSTCIGCTTSPDTIASKVVASIKQNNVSTTSTTTTATKTSTGTGGTTGTTKTYEYYKDVTTWTPNTNWTTEVKSGNNIRQDDSRTTQKTETASDSYTYRTVGYMYGSEYSYSYGLTLNNIPYDATNVRISSDSRFGYDYNNFGSGNNINKQELNQYVNSRWTCVINMVGSGCPTPNNRDNILDVFNYNMPNSWSYNISRVNRNYSNYGYNTYISNDYDNNNYGNYGYGSYQANGHWQVNLNIYNYSINANDSNRYLTPIKFTVKWDTNKQVDVKEYKYSYSTTTTEIKYSNSSNDLSLINQGYKLR